MENMFQKKIRYELLLEKSFGETERNVDIITLLEKERQKQHNNNHIPLIKVIYRKRKQQENA